MKSTNGDINVTEIEYTSNDSIETHLNPLFSQELLLY